MNFLFKILELTVLYQICYLVVFGIFKTKTDKYRYRVNSLTASGESKLALTVKEGNINIFDAIPEPILIIDGNRKIEYANIAFCELCGFKREEVIGRLCHTVSHAEDNPCLIMESPCPYDRVFSTGKTVTVTHKHRCRNGKEKIFDVKASPVFGSTGRVTKIIELLLDKTDNEVAKNRIHSSEEFLKSILEGIGEGVAVVTRDLRVIRANRRYIEMSGMSADDIKGELCYRVTHKYDRPCFEIGEDCPVVKSFKTGFHSRATHIHYDSSGNPFYVEINAYPLKDQITGGINAVIETINDVTEQMRLKDRLKRTEQIYRDLYDSSPEMLFTLNEEGIIIQCNTTMTEILGWDKNWFKGRLFTDILTPESRERFIEQKRHCNIEDICKLELEFVNSQGQRIPVDLTAKKQLQESQIVYNIVARDLSEIKKAEEEKRFLEAQLLQAQKMESLGTLSAGIAHDFNNILTGLLGYVELADKHQGSPKCSEYLAKIKELLNVASNLTRQLLLVGRKAEVEYQVFELNAFLQEFISTMERIVEDNIEIKRDLTPEPLYIKGDKSQIYQMLMNLVVNARDAMPEGGTITISTSVISADELRGGFQYQDDADFVVISVKDSGTGIPEENLSKIFDPFFTTKEKSTLKGTGLGLSVVYSIVKSHDGWIDVKSRVNEGTEFRIYLPITKDRPADKRLKSTVSDVKKDATILVVDDEEIILDIVTEALEDAGYHVLTAVKGEEAIEIIKEHGELIDLVIIDRLMPGMDGIVTFERMKEIAPSLRAIVSSGYSDEKREDLLEKGFSGYLKKPYRIDDLLQAVRDVLS